MNKNNNIKKIIYLSWSIMQTNYLLLLLIPFLGKNI